MVGILQESESPCTTPTHILTPVKAPGPFEYAIKLGKEVNADILIATDPDADRIGLAVKNKKDEYILLNGNQMMIILTEFILSKRKNLDKSFFIGSTVVSTAMIKNIAESYNVDFKVGLTGFKWIGKMINDFPNQTYIAENKIYSLNSILNNISKISNNFSLIKDRLDSLLIELNDIKTELNNPSFDFNNDFSEIEKIESRLNLIYNLQKKHSVSSISDLLLKQRELKSKLDESGSVEINIDELQKTINKKKNYLQELSKKISISRKKIIPKLKSQLESLLLNLGMKNASFDFKLFELDEFNRFGSDQIEVLFSANKGIKYAPLFKIASGGELSRILLSIKSILSKHLNLPTMIFDEIDSGVSGEMSNSMANMMLEMSSKMQIIAITHLPQVAAKGNQQLNVYKQNSTSSTTTMVKQLNKQERIDEISKMLAGDLISESAVTHAKELLN